MPPSVESFHVLSCSDDDLVGRHLTRDDVYGLLRWGDMPNGTIFESEYGSLYMSYPDHAYGRVLYNVREYVPEITERLFGDPDEPVMLIVAQGHRYVPSEYQLVWG